MTKHCKIVTVKGRVFEKMTGVIHDDVEITYAYLKNEEEGIDELKDRGYIILDAQSKTEKEGIASMDATTYLKHATIKEIPEV